MAITFEQLSNLGVYYSVSSAIVHGATMLSGATVAHIRYVNPDGNSGFDVYGDFSLNAGGSEVTGGTILQINLFDSTLSLSGIMSGLNVSYLDFKNMLTSFDVPPPSAIAASLFAGDDIIISPGREIGTRLEGFGGNDVLRAARLFGIGNDILDGGAGSDELYGFGGNDTLFGGTEADFLYGGNEDDSLLGGAGFDQLYGEAGHDILDGGTENDLLFGGSENDTLDGGSEDDTLDGGNGVDSLLGGLAGC